MTHVSLFVVDDDEFVRSSLVRRLRREGFTIDEFESGESVLKSLEEGASHPDVIIMDYKMSGINGLETAHIIHQKFPHVPVILLTAYSRSFDCDAAKRNGVFEVLTKMVELEDLRNVIHRAINHGTG